VPERLVVVRDLARRLLRQPPVGPLAAGFLCQGVGAVLLRQSPFRWVLGAYLALVAWALFHSWWRFQRRARAFLAEHPDGLDDPDAVRP
jgi:hypothetical protein